MDIKIGSEGLGYKFGKDFIEYIFKLTYGDDTAVVFTNGICDVITLTHFLNDEKRKNKHDTVTPYIFWNGESKPIMETVARYKNLSSLRYVTFSTTENLQQDNIIPIPYGFHIYLSLLKGDIWKPSTISSKERSSLFAYCISNGSLRQERSKFIHTFNRKNNSVALGKWCCEGSIQKVLSFTWNDDNSLRELVDTYSNYKFIFAAENTIKNGYLTEKMFTALAAGCIPVYLGDSVYAKKVINHKRFICVSDYGSHDKCIDFICSMTDNEIDKMRNEVVFTNFDESEIFTTVNIPDSNVNKRITSSIRKLLRK